MWEHVEGKAHFVFSVHQWAIKNTEWPLCLIAMKFKCYSEDMLCFVLFFVSFPLWFSYPPPVQSVVISINISVSTCVGDSTVTVIKMILIPVAF